MSNYETLMNLTALSDYTLALINSSTDLPEKRAALIKQIDSADDIDYKMTVLTALLRAEYKKHGSYVKAFEDVKAELTALSFTDINPSAMCYSMQSLESLNASSGIVTAMAYYDKAADALKQATGLFRRIALTYLHRVLNSLFVFKAVPDYIKQTTEISAMLKSYTREEADEYGLNAPMFMR